MLVKRTTLLSTKLLKPYFPIISPASKPPTTTMSATAINNLSAQPNTVVKPNIDEPDVGIQCYISHLPGFRGILKQRYSDFIVNEVDLDGNVVHLTSLDVPPELVEKKEEKVVEQFDKSYTSEIEEFRVLVGDTDADRLKEYVEKVTASGGGGSGDVDPLVLSPSSDKSHRTVVHNFFKEKLKLLVTDTIDGPTDSTKCIRVRLSSGGTQNRGRHNRKRKDRDDKPFDKRGSHDWPEHLGKFLRFHLYKENKDTQEVLRLIGKMLGVQPRSFGFSGTKDKRSVSTQRVTIFKQRASRVASLNERLIGIKVGDFCYAKEGLQLGQLLGNRFTITLRGVVADSEDTIRASAEALGKHGFINYFGLQRFGSGSIPTHLIGAALLRGEWKAAVDMILDPREGERDAVRQIREHYKESNNVDTALRRLPHHMVAERAILQCLKKCPGNYMQALKSIPRTLRMMYVHSYQSYLWNHAASIRVQKYGADRVVVGDLVYSKEDNCEEVISSHIECEDDVPNEANSSGNLEELLEVDVSDEKNIPVKLLVFETVPGMTAQSAVGPYPLGQCLNGTLNKAVDEEDLLKQKYTIEDIVLPLPGSRAIYPANDVADVYHDLARKDNISLTESVHNVKEFSIISMSGGYRRVFQKPMDFEWEILKYTDATIPLAVTDLDLGKFKFGHTAASSSSVNSSESTISESCDNGHPVDTSEVEGATRVGDQEVSQTALKLSFTLPTSCYATMAIRELLKTSTSVAFHKSLNDQA